MNNNKIRVAKHRIKKCLDNNKFPTEKNLQTLIDAKINIKPYIKRFKQNLDSFSTKSIAIKENNNKVPNKKVG